MRLLLCFCVLFVQGCTLGLLHYGPAKRAFPVTMQDMTLDYNPPKQIGSYLEQVYWQHLYIHAVNAMEKTSPQDVMLQVCRLFPEFNHKKEMQVYTGITRREDTPPVSDALMLAKTTDKAYFLPMKPEHYSLFTASTAVQPASVNNHAVGQRWFVYIPPNRIYLNPVYGMGGWQFDKAIYLEKKPCK